MRSAVTLADRDRMSARIDHDVVCEVFRRYAAGDGGTVREAPRSMPAEQHARLGAFGDAVRDVVAGATEDDASGFRAAFDQAQRIAAGIDTDEVLNSPHVPDGAGEYEDALGRLLLRIADGWGRWISCSRGWFELLREPSGSWRPCVRRSPCTRSRRSTARFVCTWNSTTTPICPPKYVRLSRAVPRVGSLPKSWD
jgi:hypothetical protein